MFDSYILIIILIAAFDGIYIKPEIQLLKGLVSFQSNTYLHQSANNPPAKDKMRALGLSRKPSRPSFVMPVVLGDDFQEGEYGRFGALPMICTVIALFVCEIALFAIVVTALLAYGNNAHAGGDTASARKDDGEEDSTHNEGAVEEAEEDACIETCANCGKPESDTVTLKKCNACRLVKYCSVDCQKAHRKQHKKACKQRAEELKDEELFSRGHERPEGDFCPICTLPIPLPMDDHSLLSLCCMERTCHGCAFAAKERGMSNCPFCRTPYPDPDNSDADTLAMVQARVLKKDPVAIHSLGKVYWHGVHGLQKDMRKAVELWTEAAELGSIEALFSLGVLYDRGEGGVEQDMAKAVGFYAKAAIQGHVESRYNLGGCEGQMGNYDRALRHYLISAKMGMKDSVEAIKPMFMDGIATKEQYAQSLRGYQDAVEEMKSHDRDEAKIDLEVRNAARLEPPQLSAPSPPRELNPVFALFASRQRPELRVGVHVPLRQVVRRARVPPRGLVDLAPQRELPRVVHDELAAPVRHVRVRDPGPWVAEAERPAGPRRAEGAPGPGGAGEA
ncbi:hypothetical protein THAOC_03807, partial [Thalassiosira oceanica]